MYNLGYINNIMLFRFLALVIFNIICYNCSMGIRREFLNYNYLRYKYILDCAKFIKNVETLCSNVSDFDKFNAFCEIYEFKRKYFTLL